MRKTIIILCAAALSLSTQLSSSAATPSGPWSLSDCISYALSHNISIKQSELAVQNREIELNTAQSRFLPAFQASASENLSFGRGLTADNTYTNSNTTSTSFSLGGEIPIFQGLDITNGIKQSKLALEESLSNLEKAKDDIRVAVAQAYVQILYSQEILRIASTQVAHDSEILTQIEAKRDAGRLSEAEVSAQKATLAQSQYAQTQASGQLSIALLDMTQLLELESPEQFSVQTPSCPEQQLLMQPDAIYEQALGIKPGIKAAQTALASAEVGIARAKGGYLPSLSLSGGIGSNFYTTSKVNTAPFAEQLKNNFSQYIGLNLSIPIFSRFTTRNQVRSATLNRDNSLLQLENSKKSLYKEIQQAYYNALAAQSKYSSSRESAAAAQSHYNLIVEKYTAGKASVSDYNDAKNSYLSAESEQLKAQYESLFQAKLLDFYRGVELKL